MIRYERCDQYGLVYFFLSLVADGIRSNVFFYNDVVVFSIFLVMHNNVLLNT